MVNWEKHMNLEPFSYMISYRRSNRYASTAFNRYMAYLNAIEDHMKLVCAPNSFERRDNCFLFKSLKDAFECKMRFPDHIESVTKHNHWTRTIEKQ